MMALFWVGCALVVSAFSVLTYGAMCAAAEADRQSEVLERELRRLRP